MLMAGEMDGLEACASGERAGYAPCHHCGLSDWRGLAWAERRERRASREAEQLRMLRA